MKLISFIILFFISTISCFSQGEFQFVLEGFQEIPGGKTILSKTLTSDGLIIYNLNYDFNKGSEKIVILSLDSLNLKNGVVISNAKILAHNLYRSMLIVVSQETDGVYLSQIDNEGRISKKTKISDVSIPVDSDKCDLINIVSDSEYLLCIGNKLYHIIAKSDSFEISFLRKIEGHLLKLDNSSGFNDVEYGVIEELTSGLVLNFYDHNSKFKYLTKLVSYEGGKWSDLGTNLAYLTSPDGSQTLIQIIAKASGLILSSFWLDAGIEHIDLTPSGDMINVAYIETNSDGYALNTSVIRAETPKLVPITVKISGNALNPIKLQSIGDKYLMLFANSIIIMDKSLTIVASQFFSVEKKLSIIDQVVNVKNDIYLISTIASLKFSMVKNDFWIAKRIYADFREYFVPIILSIFLLIFIQLFRHQKRLVGELLDLSNIGILLVIDSGGRLTNLNNAAKDFLEIGNSIPLRKFFRFYTKNQQSQQFADIIDKTLESKESYKGKVSIIINNSDTEWLCKTIPLRNITGMFRGVVLSAVDITEQLERKRLSNWAQLAHDMQTNLSTIKLNAEHLDIETSDNNTARQKRIVHQVKLLMQRVRDIVTVGRSDTLNLESHNVIDICNDVRNEFDDLMFPNVMFELDCKNFNILCDKAKLIRAVRNAAENGIKALKGKDGIIKISSCQVKNFALIKVEDSGIGMDEETKGKMLTPYFTTASKSGGSGIGTMIMQHVIELHGGYLIVNSEKGLGTQVIFHIPNSLSKNKEKLLSSE